MNRATPSPWRRKPALLLSLAGLVCWLLVSGWFNLRLSAWLLDPPGTALVDADCYSRMTRAQFLAGIEPFSRDASHPAATAGLLPASIAAHAFENHPFGIDSHATAPMDWAILGLWRIAGGDAAALVRAGLIVSPLLGMLLVVAVWAWARVLCMPYQWAMLLLLALSPVLLHAFAIGRPDHQSLALLVVGLALLFESARWRTEGRWLALASAGCWGLALWISWFEPLLLWILTCAFRTADCFIVSGRGKRTQRLREEVAGPVATTLCIAGLVAVFEGLPGSGIAAEHRPFFWSWAAQIGELQGASPLAAIPAWTGWLGLVMPGMLAWQWRKSRDPLCGFWLLLLLVLGLLTCWHLRWGYFFTLVFALALPLGLGAFRGKWLATAVFIASLWPLAAELERLAFPGGQQAIDAALRRQQALDLREAALALRTMDGNGVLAAWWLTPQLVYWSGKHGVAGSSHQSLPGILDAARFFLEADPAAAASILRARQADFVVVSDADQILENAAATLRRPLPDEPAMARLLQRSPLQAPAFLTLVFQNATCKVYRFHDDRL